MVFIDVAGMAFAVLSFIIILAGYIAYRLTNSGIIMFSVMVCIWGIFVISLPLTIGFFGG